MFVKCLTGIVIMCIQLKNKNKIIRGRNFLFCLLPFLILLSLYFVLIYGSIKLAIQNPEWNINYKMVFNGLFRIPITKGFDIWFPAMNLNIIFNVITLVGLFAWLIYWTFYNNKIITRNIILINIK
jgi:hypothetical protein